MLQRALISLTLLIALTGCQQQNHAQSQPNPRYQDVNYKVNKQKSNGSGQAIAKRLVDIATRIPEVHHATAVVAGRYAVVGIDLDKHLDRARVGTIKYTVAQALKKDPYGANAIVTSDPDIIERLKRMNQAIRNGKPVSGIAEQLAEIVERLMPELPNNVQTPNNTNMMNENNNQIDQKKTKNKIKQLQKNQSHS